MATEVTLATLVRDSYLGLYTILCRQLHTVLSWGKKEEMKINQPIKTSGLFSRGLSSAGKNEYIVQISL